MSGPRRNLELKAPCAGLAVARAAVVGLGATLHGVEEQTDTFFRVPAGRLKLRVVEGRQAELIWYDRPDRKETRESAYYLVPVPDPVGLKAALTAALGVRGQVAKRREVFLWHNVRIHLDRVAGLGDFVEFEAVLSRPEDAGPSQERLVHLGRVLGIDPAATLAPSYTDLLGI